MTQPNFRGIRLTQCSFNFSSAKTLLQLVECPQFSTFIVIQYKDDAKYVVEAL